MRCCLINTKLITNKDFAYPEKLKQIPDKPLCLFYRGNIDLLKRKSIAIIGSREYSNYGKQIAVNFAYSLAKLGLTIVSGGARGIDSFATMGAIAAGGSVILVLGNSIEYVYPPENKELEEKVIENDGLIISEYMAGTKPCKYTFPERNRLISGISDGVLVVEAGRESGALITVDFALEQGKSVFAVPGNITSRFSMGTNELIKQGAKATTKIEDILEEIC